MPPGTEGLSYTGNEKVWPFCEQAAPAPRGHSVPVPGELGGASMVIDLLLKRAADLGVQIRYETGATGLVVDDEGGVVGVRWKHFGETGEVKANAVIIAAGGFAMNADMVAEYTPALGKQRKTKHHGMVAPFILGNPNDDGLGIGLGVSAGGVAHEPGQTVHHRGRLSARDPAHRRHRQQGRASGSSPRTPTIRAPRLSCSSSPTSRPT